MGARGLASPIAKIIGPFRTRPPRRQLTFIFMRCLLRAGLVDVAGRPGYEERREMKVDPEEPIIAAALDQTALNQANERGAGARIEFSRDGHAGLPDNRVGLTVRGVDYGSTADHPAPGA